MNNSYNSIVIDSRVCQNDNIMNLLKILLLIMLLSLFTACSWIYPEYNKPNLKVNATWSIPNSNKSVPSIANVAWWHDFNDPQLNGFVESALKNNNSVNTAINNIGVAKGQLKAIQLGFIPSMSLYSGYSTNPSLGNPGGFYGAWPGYFSLNIFSTLARERSAKINLEAQKYVLQATRLILISEVVSSYMTLLAHTEQQILVDNLIKDMQSQVDIEKVSFQNGITSKYNYDEELANLKTIEATKHIIDANIIKSQNALCYLLNEAPHKIIIKNKFSNIKINDTNPNMYPTAVLNNRPDVKFAEEKYKLAVQNTALPYMSIMPNITLDQFMGGFNSFSAANPLGGVANMTDSYVYSTLNPAIFGQIDSYNASEKMAFYDYIDAVNKVLRDVDNSLVDFNANTKSYNNITERYVASHNKYDLQKNLYKTGNISKLALIKEQVNLDAVTVELNQAKLIKANSLIKVYQELGGGFANTISR